MKILFNIAWLAVISMQCDDKIACKEELCQPSDSRFVGKWTLLQECKCYDMGGDFIWKTIFDKFIYTFDDKCVISIETDDNDACTQGKYSIGENLNTKQPQLILKLKCIRGGTTTSPYDYLFNTKGDTLMLKGYVDEGFVGLKFLRLK